MSTPSTTKRRHRKKKRVVTKRIRDKEGNIIVKRFKRKESGFRIPGLTWSNLPSIILASIFGFYAFTIYRYNNGTLPKPFPFEFLDLNPIFDTFASDVFLNLLLLGMFGVFLASLFAWVFLFKGFKIKEWPSAGRQFLTAVIILIVFGSLFSAFFNEFGVVRQQDELDTSDSDFDISNLSAPFYSELTDGLFDMLGDLPEADDLLASVEPLEGEFFDYNSDTYLWKWQSPETYDDEDYDFEKGYESVELPLTQENLAPSPFTLDQFTGDSRIFKINQQFGSASTSYSGETLNTWNSIYDADVDFSQIETNVLNKEDVTHSSVSGVQSVNQQPILKAKLSEALTQGYISYYSRWIEEPKENVTSQSMSYENLIGNVSSNDLLYNIGRFGDLSKAGTISSIWGLDSLPDNYITNSYTIGDGNFGTKYDDYKSFFETNDYSVYEAVLTVNNEIKQDIAAAIIDDPDNFNFSSDSLQDAPPVPYDRAYYYYDQVENGDPFNAYDVLTAFNNMLRSLEIPTRPVFGFSIGDVTSNLIEFYKDHLHVWFEVLIPWTDSEGNTQLSWAAFNPIPDVVRYDETGDFEYGKNTYGGNAEVEVTMTTGDTTDVSGEPGFEGLESITTQNMGSAINGTARVLLEGDPVPGQNIDIKLLNETEVNLINPNDPTSFSGKGIDLPSIESSNTDGWVDFSLKVNAQGNLSFEWEGEPNYVDQNYKIENLAVLGPPGDKNVYFISFFYGFNYEFLGIGWNREANLTLTSELDIFAISDPSLFDGNSTQVSYVVEWEEVNLTAIYEDLGGNPLEGETNLDLLLMDTDTFTNLPIAIAAGTFNAADYHAADFPATNASGYSQTTYQINGDIVNPGEYWVLVAQLAGTLIYDSFVIKISGEMSLDITLDYSSGDGDKVISTGETVNWTLNVDAQYFDSVLGFPPRDAVGANLTYYAIEKDQYESNNGTYTTLNSILGSCNTVGGTFALCYEFTENTGNLFYKIGGDPLGEGIDAVNLTIDYFAFANNIYYIVAVSHDFQVYDQTVTFGVIASLLTQSSVNKNNYAFEESTPELQTEFNSDNQSLNNIWHYFIAIKVLVTLMVIRRYNL